MRVLFLVPYPTDGASNRLRIEQYLPLLEEKCVKGQVCAFMSQRLYSIFYKEGRRLEKFLRLGGSLVRRILVLLKANQYDVVVIHRRIFPFWNPIARFLFRRIRRPIIYDFDDAVFLSDNRGSVLGRLASKLGQPKQVAEILKASTIVIAGNQALRDYAQQFHSDVRVMPTPVNDELFRPARKKKDPHRLIIGWIGSHTTAPYLQKLDETFKSLLAKFPELEIHIIGGHYELPGDNPRIRNIPWKLETERHALSQFDIGVMPLKDDVWEQYKCGFKALLYMSMGIPVVCSPVGANNQIVCDGLNGFFAKTNDEWIGKMVDLLEDKVLRQKMGEEGRRTVEQIYSVRTNAPEFLQILDDAFSAGQLKGRRFNQLQNMTQKSFDFQWTQFPDMVPANEDHFLNYISPLRPDFFRGKLVLDAACGFGRHVYYASTYQARRIVGMDFSNAIFSAREVNEGRPNVSLVKGDIYKLPFQKNSFDCIYSLGALHHLPDPEGGFHALMQYVKPSGAVAIWVYSKKRRWLNYVLESVRFVTRNIPFATLKKISFFCACVDYFCFIFPYKLLRRIPLIENRMLPRVKLYAKFPFWVNYADWFDRFSAPVRYYFNSEDMKDWGRRAGLINVIVSATGQYGWRLYGERPPADIEQPVKPVPSN